jgi:signal transduction histidine kinase
MSEMRELLSAVSISSDHLKEIVDTVLTLSMLEQKQMKIEKQAFQPRKVIFQLF